MAAHPSHGLWLIVAALAYFTAAKLGLAVASVYDGVTLIWAPAGIGLGLVLLWGPRMLLAVIVAQLAIGASGANGFAFTLAATLAACVEALLAVWLLGRSRFDSFRRRGDVLRLVWAGGVASGVAAAIGAGGRALTSDVSWLPALGSWWLGDSAGMLLVTPLFLAFSGETFRSQAVPWWRRIEAGAWLFVVGALGVLVFGGSIGTTQSPLALAFILSPVGGLAVYRLGLPMAASANLLLAGVALWGTLTGSGPFAVTGSLPADLAFAWFFMGVSAFAGLQLAALLGAREVAVRTLRDNLAWLDLIQEEAGVGVWSWDSRTDEFRTSDALLSMFGVSDSEPSTSRAKFAARVHPEDLEALERAGLHTARTGEPANVEFRAIAPDGGIRWYAVKAARTSGDPERKDSLPTVGISIDITDTRQLQEAVRRNDRLASLGTFAAGLAHEINNPVGGILLAAHAARARSRDGELVGQALDDIIEDAERAGRIIKNMLRFSKESAAERAPYDLNECLRSAARLSHEYAELKGVAIDLDLAETHLVAECDSMEIEQVVVNLIRNAVEASPNGGRIRLESSQSGGAALVRVSDDGVGMTEAVRDRAFDPFYTTRTNQGGSGLGLSICHGILESHHGQISIDSEPDGGTTVELSLPQGEDTVPAPSTPPAYRS